MANIKEQPTWELRCAEAELAMEVKSHHEHGEYDMEAERLFEEVKAELKRRKDEFQLAL